MKAATLFLSGVGSPIAGEWADWTGRAFHLRRRLSVEEEKLVGPVVDIRGTQEAFRRLGYVQRWIPKGWTE